MIFDSTGLEDYTLVIFAIAAAFIAALWLSLIIWTARDIGRRSSDGFTRVLAVLVVTILFIPGWLLYLILRPANTLEDEYQRTLEEEALLQNIEDIARCPGCNRRIQPDWMVCPNCHTMLKKSCHQCWKLIELPWNVCPYCGTPVSGTRTEDMPSDGSDESSKGENPFIDAVSEEPSDKNPLNSNNKWVFFSGHNPEDPESQLTPPES